jgi:hypothetical protein
VVGHQETAPGPEIIVGKKKAPTQGKLRTREHVIADLAVNHVERQVLLCGCTVERVVHDYGIDLILFTYSPLGEWEDGNVFLQIKATEHLEVLRSGQAASFRVKRADLQGWLFHVLPVVLIVYDVSGDRAYWVHVQGYFQTDPGFNVFRLGATFTMHLPTSQVLTPEAVRHFGVLRDQAFKEHR